jgi:hypothetical protein
MGKVRKIGVHIPEATPFIPELFTYFARFARFTSLAFE